MKTVKQFGIILIISLLGELLNHLIPLPVPASIYGMVIMLLCLCLKIIRVSDVKETSDFLLETMTIMFIPAATGLITTLDVLRDNLAAYAAVIVVSTLIVMVVSGRVTQRVLDRERKERGK